MGYRLWVLAGIVLAFLATRWQGRPPAALAPHRAWLTLAAVAGAVAGAYLGELPAELAGWSAGPVGADAGLPLGGRTVLGGLLGGWLAVELAKWRLGLRLATGDGFALPLALALACGRLGCWSAGCCAGRGCDPAAWYAAVGVDGQTRIPVQLIEAVFHGTAALLLACAHRRDWWPGRRLAAYLAAYAVLRLGLEGWRGAPPVLLGATWYQFLALTLLVLAGCTWWRRRPRGISGSAGACI
jgi:phosphatidylglycerol:prolipoprotein diacylglycerol transferase